MKWTTFSFFKLYFMNNGKWGCSVCHIVLSGEVRTERNFCKVSDNYLNFVSVRIKYAVQLIGYGKLDNIRTLDLRTDFYLSIDLITKEENHHPRFTKATTYYTRKGVVSIWGRISRHGETFGIVHVATFVIETNKMFLFGFEDKRKALSPGRLIERLRFMYPNRFDVPSKTEICQKAGALFATLKKRGEIESTARSGVSELCRGSFV